MNLPKIEKDINYIKVKLPSGKLIGVRGWKVKDEKDLLFILDSENNIEEKKEKHIVDFLSKCSDNQVEFNKLSEQDIRKFAIEARKLSKGDGIEYNYQCPHCKAKSFDEVKLSKAEVTKSFDNTPAVITDELTVVFKDISFNKDEELYEKYKESSAKYRFYSILNSIEGITYKGETYTDLKDSNIEEFLDNFESDDLSKIYDEHDKRVSSVEIERKIICLQCTKEIIMEFGELKSFLVF